MPPSQSSSKANTIDLCCIPPQYSTTFRDAKLNLEKDRPLDTLLIRQYHEQENLSNEIFDQWLFETNEQLINDVNEFIETSLAPYDNPDKLLRSLRGEPDLTTQALFPYVEPVIYAVTIIIGMQSGDHAATIDILESHVKKANPRFQIFRVPIGFSKKAQIAYIRDGVKNSRRSLVIIEQTESVPPSILSNIARSLQSLVQNDKEKFVVVMFCFARGGRAVQDFLPYDATCCFGKVRTIIKESGDVVGDIDKKLVNTRDVRFKLGPKVLSLIKASYTEVDASISNVKYIYQFALSEHSYRHISLLNLPVGDLVVALKQELIPISYIKNLDTLKDFQDSPEIDWGDPVSVANFCKNKIEDLLNYFDFIRIQTYYYLELLRDETGSRFPSDSVEIYCELMDPHYDNLAKSQHFADALASIRKYPIDRLLTRLRCSTSKRHKLPPSIKRIQDVYDLLKDYERKLENNDNSSDIVGKLIQDLFEHGAQLKNPTKLPLIEALFYDEADLVRRRTMPARDSLISFGPQSSYFNILYNLIEKSSEEMSVSHLFEDFKQIIREREGKVFKKPREVSPLRQNTPILIRKTTPKRGETPKMTPKLRQTRAAARSSGIKLPEVHGKEFVRSRNEIPDDNGLMKAIFVDLIDTMTYQGLVQPDRRRSKKGTLKRCAWLTRSQPSNVAGAISTDK